MLIQIENETFDLLSIYAGFAGRTSEQMANLLLAASLQTLIELIKEDKNDSKPQNSDSVLKCDCSKKEKIQ